MKYNLYPVLVAAVHQPVPKEVEAQVCVGEGQFIF
jgi:hypothetical protein